MNVFTRFTLADRIILGGSTLILLILSYFLYDDSLLFPTPTSQNSPIGIISTSIKDVRKKSTHNFVWLPGNREDQVYDQDSIFTGEDSGASIQLHDGSLIKIKENSLVNLNTKNGQMQLDLRFGQFAGNGKSPLHVKTGNEEYTIQGNDAEFKIDRSPGGTMDVRLLSGTAEITSKMGIQKLKANESLKISKDKMEKHDSKANIRLLTKDGFVFIRGAEPPPLSFVWEGQGLLAQFQFEISPTEDFKKILALHTTEKQKISLKNSLKAGTYFWRIKGLDMQQQTVATSLKHKFVLSDLNSPQFTSPKNQSLLTLKVAATDKEPKNTTQISWQAEEPLAIFHWQLSKTAEFTEIISEKNLKEKTLITPSLGQGTYFVRVRGFDKNQIPSSWSPAHSFTFEFEMEAKPPAPLLAKKFIRFVIPKTEDRAPSETASPQMAWSKVESVKKYRWEVANNSRFIAAQAAETPATKVNWEQYKPGKYFFRVFARSDLGQNSEASETGVLEVYGAAPALQPLPEILVRETNIHAKAPAKETAVKWTPVEGAKLYVVDLDQDPGFTQPLQIKTSALESLVSLPQPGTYFLRVKAFNESSQEISEFSNVEEVNYIFKQTLSPPVLIEPNDKTTVFLQKDMEPLLWLEWGAVPDATKYNLEVSTTADFSRKVISKTLAESRFLLQTKIPYGNIYWRVNAVKDDEAFRSDWATRQFMIYHQRNDGF